MFFSNFFLRLTIGERCLPPPLHEARDDTQERSSTDSTRHRNYDTANTTSITQMGGGGGASAPTTTTATAHDDAYLNELADAAAKFASIALASLFAATMVAFTLLRLAGLKRVLVPRSGVIGVVGGCTS